jgi:LAS superfamily LD-carboxypeptidase LdcB
MITKHNLMGLDDCHLIECQFQHKLQPQVCLAFKEMQRAALADGIDCQIVSAYRGFTQQLAIWQKKWAGEKVLLDINEKPLEFSSLNDEDKLHAILTWSALPGTSRHHWGTDLDVYDRHSVKQCAVPFQLVQTEYEAANGPCFMLNNWLSQHAEKFGFNRPYQDYHGGVAAEPWHLSYQSLAEEGRQTFDLDALKQVLVEHEIAGLNLILANLPSIYQRYVLNLGHS